MVKKLSPYFQILLGLIGIFTLGMYAMSVQYDIKPVKPHQWLLTSMFAVFFLINGINEIKTKN